MAAAMLICGHKRSFFEDPESPISVFKKPRYYCSSPVLLPPPAVDEHIIDHTFDPLNDTSAAADASSRNNPSPDPDNHADSIVESFVQEMTCATSLDDARSRASRLLEVFELSITEKVSADFGRENGALKEKINEQSTALSKCLGFIKNRHKELEDTKRELQNMKELDAQSKEQLKKLEFENYTLKTHLIQAAHQNTSIPSQFHPHVY